MVKKIILCILCMGVLFSAPAEAQNEVQSEVSEDYQAQDKQFIPNENESQIPPEGKMPEGTEPVQGDNQMGDRGMGGRKNGMGMPPGGMEQMPGGFPGFDEQSPAQSTGDTTLESVSSESAGVSFSQFLTEYSTPTLSMVILVFGFVFVIFYKRNKF